VEPPTTSALIDRISAAVRGEDDPPGMEKRSLTDPGSRGLSRTDSRTSTPESHETRGEGPNAPDGQPDKASYTVHDECGQTSLTIECYDSGV
jgi:hypothetical protein